MATLSIADRTFNRSLVKTFSAINATAGTGLAEAIKTGFVATAAALVLRNATAGLLRPRYLRMVNTVVPASGSAMHMRIALDSGATRVSSGGTALTAKSRDMSQTATSGAVCTFGAVVTAAATANVRYISQSSPSAVIPVVGDELLVVFGGADAPSGMGTFAGTTARRIVMNVGPVTLGNANEMIVHTWYPSNASTAASWEVECCWEEAKK